MNAPAKPLALTQRPPTRGGCIDGPRPCLAACRYRLERGPDTCALDVADRDGVELNHVAQALGLSRQRVQQIEASAMAKLRATWLELYGDELGLDTAAALRRMLPGREITRMRVDAGVSRHSLAQLLGGKFTESLLERFEKGRQPVAPEVLDLISDALACAEEAG